MDDFFEDVSDYREQREAREATEARRTREAEAAADVHAATVEAAAAEFSRKARELGIPTSTREEYARGLWELGSSVCV